MIRLVLAGEKESGKHQLLLEFYSGKKLFFTVHKLTQLIKEK